MRIPSTLTSLAEQGLIDEVVRPLLSGKEAEVFLVWAGGELRVAKVYKEAQNRSFKNRADYTEGRKVRNSRDQRAIDKRSRHGRAQDEAAWRSTEVDMIYRLRDAGVRVPAPYHFIDGVLIMEMVADAEGAPAPRLAEIGFAREEAIDVFHRLLAEVVRMLAAGVVHGDLSDFNVLMSADGPVIIDFPQSVDAASNLNARRILQRDVDNLKRFLTRFAPDQRPGLYAEELWDLYSNSMLTPETRLTGRYRAADRRVNTAAVLSLIGDANYDERKRRERQGMGMRGVPDAPRPGQDTRPASGGPSQNRDAQPRREPQAHETPPREAQPQPPREAQPQPPREAQPPHRPPRQQHEPHPPQAHEPNQHGQRPPQRPRPQQHHDGNNGPQGPRPPQHQGQQAHQAHASQQAHEHHEHAPAHARGPRPDHRGPRPDNRGSQGPRPDNRGFQSPRPDNRGPQGPRPDNRGPQGPRPDNRGHHGPRSGPPAPHGQRPPPHEQGHAGPRPDHRPHQGQRPPPQPTPPAPPGPRAPRSRDNAPEIVVINARRPPRPDQG